VFCTVQHTHKKMGFHHLWDNADIAQSRWLIEEIQRHLNFLIEEERAANERNRNRRHRRRNNEPNVSDDEDVESEFQSESDFDDDEHWTVLPEIRNRLGPAASDVITEIRDMNRKDAVQHLQAVLGPAASDVLEETRGRFFTQDPQNDSE